MDKIKQKHKVFLFSNMLYNVAPCCVTDKELFYYTHLWSHPSWQHPLNSSHFQKSTVLNIQLRRLIVWFGKRSWSQLSFLKTLFIIVHSFAQPNKVSTPTKGLSAIPHLYLYYYSNNSALWSTMCLPNFSASAQLSV